MSIDDGLRSRVASPRDLARMLEARQSDVESGFRRWKATGGCWGWPGAGARTSYFQPRGFGDCGALSPGSRLGAAGYAHACRSAADLSTLDAPIRGGKLVASGGEPASLLSALAKPGGRA